jgi:hypothetical protein
MTEPDRGCRMLAIMETDLRQSCHFYQSSELMRDPISLDGVPAIDGNTRSYSCRLSLAIFHKRPTVAS